MNKFILAILFLATAAVLGAAVYWQGDVRENDKPLITLVWPNGGELLEEGSDFVVKWNTQNIPVANKISINIRRANPDMAQAWQEFDPLIFAGLDNTGSKEWHIADTYPEGDYILGITSYKLPMTNAVSDESDAAFKIIRKDKTADQAYINDKFGYSVDYPGDWIAREYPGTQTGAGFRPGNSADEVAECINIDVRSVAGNDDKIAFGDYVKVAAANEIQGFEKINSIKTVVTATGLAGYETTWKYKDMKGAEKISLPITYFENKNFLPDKDSNIKYKTIQIILGDEKCQEVYNKMLNSFGFAR